jgi:hydrogenase maturation protease
MSMKILILGIGQSLRGDDAAGLEAVQLWQAQHPDSAAQAQVELSELPGLALLDLLEGMDAAILVDAVQTPAPAGTVIRLGPHELAGFTPEAGSAHGWGVTETLEMGRSLYPSLANCQVTLIGIVGKDFSIGAGLDPNVRAAMERVADMIEMEIQKYLT